MTGVRGGGGAEGPGFYGLISEHPLIGDLVEAIGRAAPLEAPVVICGPTGSGKELVARALHACGPGAGRPFCPINVAAVPDALVESELFGVVRGAFTGAAQDRAGLIETRRAVPCSSTKRPSCHVQYR